MSSDIDRQVALSGRVYSSVQAKAPRPAAAVATSPAIRAARLGRLLVAPAATAANAGCADRKRRHHEQLSGAEQAGQIRGGRVLLGLDSEQRAGRTRCEKRTHADAAADAN